VLRGNHPARIDEKGRLKVPNGFRSIVEAQWGSEVFVTSVTGEFVRVYPMGVWLEIERKLAEVPSTHPSKLRFLDRDSEPQPGELVLTTDSAALRTARVPGGLIVGRVGDSPANAVKGDTSKRAELVKAMGSAKIDSPRGSLTLSSSHNPIHDMYLRKVEGKENKVIGIAIKDLTDPPRGCKL